MHTSNFACEAKANVNIPNRDIAKIQEAVNSSSPLINYFIDFFYK